MARAIPPPPIPIGVRLPSRIQNGQIGSSAPKAFGSPGRGPSAPTILLQPGPALGRVQTEDRQVNAAIEAQRLSTAQVKGLPFADAKLIENVAFSGSTLVQHGLGRAFRSCLLCAPSALVTWAVQRPSGIAQDAQAVLVGVSAPCTADLLVW